MATFKEMCLDTDRPDSTVAEFWAAATGCRAVVFQEPADVVGEQEGMGIAICPVPDPKAVKNRVHLDVHTGSIDELTALGATVLDDTQPWTVLADPEGNEFCAFVREGELPAYRTYEINVDSSDPEDAARWWGEAFGVAAENHGEPWWWISGVGGFPPGSRFGPFAMVFAPVPEAKTVKNRMHWDVVGTVVEFTERGATPLWTTPGWEVLADPWGNEFCVFPPDTLTA